LTFVDVPPVTGTPTAHTYALYTRVIVGGGTGIVECARMKLVAFEI